MEYDAIRLTNLIPFFVSSETGRNRQNDNFLGKLGNSGIYSSGTLFSDKPVWLGLKEYEKKLLKNGIPWNIDLMLWVWRNTTQQKIRIHATTGFGL